MGDDDLDISIDDLVTKDDLTDLQDTIDEIRDEIPEDVPDIDPDAVITKDEIGDHVAPEAERTAKGFFEHVMGEECDDATCEAVRDAIGVSPDDDEESDSDDPEASDDDADDADESDEAEADDEGGDSGESGDEPKNAAFPDEL